MAAPSTIPFLVQGSVSLAEVWFVGQLSSISLAAIALAFPFLMLTRTTSGGAMGGAVASAIAWAVGAGDINRAEQLIWHALALGVAGALLLLLLFGLGGHAFLRLLGGNSEVLAQVYAYTLLILLGGVLIWNVGITTAIFRGMGSMQLPAAAMVSGCADSNPLVWLLNFRRVWPAQDGHHRRRRIGTRLSRTGQRHFNRSAHLGPKFGQNTVISPDIFQNQF